jgi:hypothetical protein
VSSSLRTDLVPNATNHLLSDSSNHSSSRSRRDLQNGSNHSSARAHSPLTRDCWNLEGAPRTPNRGGPRPGAVGDDTLASSYRTTSREHRVSSSPRAELVRQKDGREEGAPRTPSQRRRAVSDVLASSYQAGIREHRVSSSPRTESVRQKDERVEGAPIRTPSEPRQAGNHDALMPSNRTRSHERRVSSSLRTEPRRPVDRSRRATQRKAVKDSLSMLLEDDALPAPDTPSCPLRGVIRHHSFDSMGTTGGVQNGPSAPPLPPSSRDIKSRV